jgi:hypothetical protein
MAIITGGEPAIGTIFVGPQSLNPRDSICGERLPRLFLEVERLVSIKLESGM